MIPGLTFQVCPLRVETRELTIPSSMEANEKFERNEIVNYLKRERKAGEIWGEADSHEVDVNIAYKQTRIKSK